MEFTFLGTSAGTPTRSRNVTGLALCLSGPKPWYLVDCGEGTQHQVMRTRYSVMQLRAIFITHIHGDHIFGLPGLLTSASMLGRTEPLDIIAPPQVRRFIDAVIENSDSSLSYPLNFINSKLRVFTGRMTIWVLPTWRFHTGYLAGPTYSQSATWNVSCKRRNWLLMASSLALNGATCRKAKMFYWMMGACCAATITPKSQNRAKNHCRR